MLLNLFCSWGQATAILNDKLLISGGKTDLQHQYTYTSAPNCNDLLALDLSVPFTLSSPSWSYISGSQNSSTSQGPAVAFHTLTPYTSSELLLFGGDSGFGTIQTNADSAWLLNIKDLTSPSWSSQAAGWASEPIRRIYHAAPSASGAVYILGGQKADGSQIGFPDPYLFNAVADSGSPAFIPLTGQTSAPAGLFGHAAHVLPGGTLLVFGGFFSSGSTPNSPSPFTTIYTLDTTSASPVWSIQNATGGIIPIPRRGFASALLSDGKILIHGGADAAIQTLYSDAAILDTTHTPMTWSSIAGLSDTLGPRVGHFAVPLHDQILFGFGMYINSLFVVRFKLAIGWAGNAAASANLALYDLTSGTFQPNYTPPSTPVSITTLPVSPTSPGGTYPSSGTNIGQGGLGSPTRSGTGSSPSSGSAGGQAGGGGGGQVDGSIKGSSSKLGLVVGSVLGFFAFVGLVGGGVYRVLKQRERRAGGFYSNSLKNPENRWSLIAERDALDEFPTQSATTVQMAGTRWHDQPRRAWRIPVLNGFLGIGGTTTERHRVDMLADEDARQFDIDHEEGDTWSYRSRRGTRRQGTGGSSVSTERLNAGRSPWNDVWNASVTSLKNIGVAFGVAPTASAAAREGSVYHPEWWEKDELPLDPFQDPAPAVESGSALVDINPLIDKDQKLGPNDGESIASLRASPKLYVDPFADSHEGEAHARHVTSEDTASLLADIHDEHTAATSGGGHTSQSSLPRSFGMMGIARAGTASPGSSERDRGTSVESHDAPSSQATHSISLIGSGVISTDQNSSVSSLPSPMTTSIVGAITKPNVSMRRSDSWWSRFSRTSFLDRHSIHDASHRNASVGGLADFRDPNPAPRLGAIQESAPPSRQATEDSNLPMSGGGASKIKPRKTGSGYALSTKSSIKTANSELIEGMDGRMEVVQRALSLTSRGTASPSTFDSHDRWGSSSRDASGSDETHRRSWTISDGEPESFIAESPATEFGDGSSLSTRTEVSVLTPSDPSGLSTGAGVQQRYRPPRRALTGAVASRVLAYERRLSQDVLTQSPPLNTKPRLKNEQSRRGGVGYGLAVKAPLFVANPDRTAPGSS